MKKTLLTFLLALNLVGIANAYPQFEMRIDDKKVKNLNFEIGTNEEKKKVSFINLNKKEPLFLQIEFVDAKLNEKGEINYKVTEEGQAYLGKWFKFSEQNINIPPLETKDIFLNITIPKNEAQPGTYLGGLSTSLSDQNTAELKNISYGKVKTRAIDQAVLTIPGNITKETSVSGFYFDKNNFIVKIKNSGNSISQVNGEIRLLGTDKSFEINKTIIEKNSERTIEFPWKDHPKYISGDATLSLNIAYFNSEKSEFVQDKIIKKSAHFQIIPWNEIFIGLGLLLLLILLIIAKKVLKKMAIKNSTEYVVNANESLISIAEKNNLSWKKIAKLNNLKPPYELKPGEKIMIPKK